MSSMASAIQHITCLDLNDEHKVDLSPCEGSVKQPVHKTVVTLNNCSPVKQSASFTSLSSLTKPFNKGVSFAKYSVQIYSDGDKQTMTPCLVVNSDTASQKSLSNPSTLNSSRNNSVPLKSGIKDLNYESGIVSRLRERFSQIERNEARDSQAISYASRKRFLSVDDVLASCQASSSHQKQVPISSYSKTQNFWQSVPKSLQTSCSADSISKTTATTRSVYFNGYTQKPEARPKNGLTGQKSVNNNFAQLNGIQEAVYVIVRPNSDRHTDQLASPLEWTNPHLSTSTNFEHLTLSRPQERFAVNVYQPSVRKELNQNSGDQITMEPISKLRERFERCSRAQKTDSLTRTCTMPRSRSAHVYPSTKIRENIEKFESGTRNKKPVAVINGKEAKNVLSSSPPADPQPYVFKQMPLLSKKLVEIQHKVSRMDKPTSSLAAEESSDASPPPEEPHPFLLTTKPQFQDQPGHNQLAISANNMISCDVRKTVEIAKELTCVPTVAPQAENHSGKEEMQRLLNKFNQKRGAREALRSTNFSQSNGPKATIMPSTTDSREVFAKKEQPSIGHDKEPECSIEKYEYIENLMRPSAFELSNTLEKAAILEVINTIPPPDMDTLGEVGICQSKSCAGSSVDKTCRSSFYTNPSFSTSNQPRKSLSARYFEEKQRSNSMASSTSSKASCDSEKHLKEPVDQIEKVEVIIEQEEEEEESLNQTSSSDEKSSCYQSSEQDQQEHELEKEAEKEIEDPQPKMPLESYVEEKKEKKEVKDTKLLEVIAQFTSKGTNLVCQQDEIKCLSGASIENDSTDDGENSNEDFLTDDFEYSSSLKASLVEDEMYDHSWKTCLMPEYSMLASDGNPVRHSLLNLADPEDIPELLAAMAEEHNFVFEDYSSSSQMSSCGIIQLSDKRKPKQFSGRITFVEDPPQVFAYLDESSAKEDGEWQIGCAITFEDYQKMTQSVQDEVAQQHLELARWRQSMQNKCSDFQQDSLTKPIKQLIIGQDISVLNSPSKITS